ncbi:MAG: peroxiredoxin [Candidatus Sericytochromatia bacterium]|nr:peroxiredoxin [Candidatus Sericytochromatia bacterium]
METLIQKKAPDFSADAVMPNGEITNLTLSDFKGKKYVVLFFYPLDFTFVCPSEIIAFSHRIAEFESRGVQVLGCSVDSQFSHFAWRKTAISDGGIGEITYPLVADLNKNIARSYGVLLDDAVALRGTFLIDKDGIVRHATLNDLPLGRNVDETLRLVDALQHTEQHGEVCPAGWNKGEQAMTPTAAGVATYLKEKAAAL